MKLFVQLFFIISFYTVSCLGKVLIITHSYNRPDFIEIQHKTFAHFLQDEYEYVVFNDAPHASVAQEIESTCARLGITCIRIPQSIHTKPYLPKEPHEDGNHSCKRCAHVVQYSLDTVAFEHNDLVCIIDSDMFLVKPFSIREYMHDYRLAGVYQSRVSGSRVIEYLWNGLLFFDMPRLPDKKSINFNCGWVEGAPCDVGGYTYYYLKAHPSLELNFFQQTHVGRWKDEWITCSDCNNMHCNSCINSMQKYGFSEPAIRYIQDIQVCPDYRSEFFINEHFLHYGAGGNWNERSKEYHQIKTNALNNFITSILS